MLTDRATYQRNFLIHIYSDILRNLQKKIWETLSKTEATESDLRNELVGIAHNKIRSSIEGSEKSDEKILFNIKNQGKLGLLIEKHIQVMIDTALKVYASDPLGEPACNFRLNDNVIEMKREEKFVKTTFHGYYNVFFYLKFMSEKGILNQLNPTQFGYFSFSGGSLSYALIPQLYKRIFGVTGTLRNLIAQEQSFINHCGDIKQFSYFPSFFGRVHIADDNPVSLQDSEEEWANEIVRKLENINKSIVLFLFSSSTRTT